MKTNETKHTPGPWYIQNEGSQSIIVSQADCEQPAVARIYNHNCERSKANARLIAATPELLKALESCHKRLTILHNSGLLTCNEEIIQARAAIAKAKGEA